VNEYEAKGFPGDDGLLLGQLEQVFSSDNFGFESYVILQSEQNSDYR